MKKVLFALLAFALLFACNEQQLEESENIDLKSGKIDKNQSVSFSRMEELISEPGLFTECTNPTELQF